MRLELHYVVKDVEFFNKLDKNKVEKLYSGKTGCACGCGGNYFEEGIGLTRGLNKLKKWFNEGKEINVVVFGSGEVCVYHDQKFEERARRAYFKDLNDIPYEFIKLDKDHQDTITKNYLNSL